VAVVACASSARNRIGKMFTLDGNALVDSLVDVIVAGALLRERAPGHGRRQLSEAGTSPDNGLPNGNAV
jgi:hypothetical protein